MTSRLLLIEDDEVAVYVTCALLKSSGFSAPIDVVGDGLEALAYLTCEGYYADRQTGNPSLILLDLNLPGIDGFELFKQVRSNPTLSSIPVFILSASSTDEDMYRSVLLGVSKYLTKPLDMQEFREGTTEIFSSPRSIH
jgi:CheY-like chemotaxis protein